MPRSHTVRSVPPALRGMIHSALPLPSDVKNRKALVIGCSYMETSNALLGAFNDAWNASRPPEGRGHGHGPRC